MFGIHAARNLFNRNLKIRAPILMVLLFSLFYSYGTMPVEASQASQYQQGMYQAGAPQPSAFNWTRQSDFRGPTTGELLKWSYQTNGGIISSPAIGADGTVYVGSFDGRLYAFNTDGTLKWSFAAGNGIASSPAIGFDGTIFVGSLDHKLYAVNPDGTLRWVFTTGAGISSSPSIGFGGTIYVASLDSKLYALTYTAGSLLWFFQTQDQLASSPAIGSDGTVYVGSHDKKLYAIDSYGSLKWSRLLDGSDITSAPAIGSDGTIYVGTFIGNMFAINPNGNLNWHFVTGGTINSSPAIGSDGTIYIGAFDGTMYALNHDPDPVTLHGTIKWTYTAGERIQSSPIIGSDGMVYVGSYDHNLYAINADGSLNWSYGTGGSIISSPAIGGDGTIYVGSEDGKLYALTNPASGNADLNGLSASTGAFNEPFASGATSYSQSVGNSVTGMTVTPTVADSTATVTVNGSAVASGQASGEIALNVGANTINVVVKAQNSSTKTYTLSVTRAASSNADLSGLSVSAGTFDLPFAAGTTSYTLSVANNVPILMVTPTTADSTATVTVNGSAVTSGQASGTMLLNDGANTITVVVTAQDGSTKTYTVTVTVDKTPPITTASVSGAANPSGWYKSDPVITLSASDNHSGVAQTLYRINGTQWVNYTQPVSISTEGIQTFEYKSVDHAGNEETAKSLTIKLDKTAPTLQVVLNNTSLWPPNHKLVTITATVLTSDSLSEVESVVLTSITSNEPDYGLGDGDQPNDIQGVTFGILGTAFMLRAERSEKGIGRVYTITYTTTDYAGNKTTASATVLVPHNS